MKKSRLLLGRFASYLSEVRRRNKSICYYCKRLFDSPKAFTFQGKTYTELWHRYNATWRNERAVEVPIIREMVSRAGGAAILEVGNVLSHYGAVHHQVLDKYEKTPGVINEDVCAFHPPRKYDLIVSISTLEHVGWDEEPREPRKVLDAFNNLRSLCAPGGRIVVTLPLGSNPFLDNLIREGKIEFTKQFYLERISPANEWREVEAIDFEAPRYDEWLPAANELLIGIIQC